jgi:hypothetical protein
VALLTDILPKESKKMELDLRKITLAEGVSVKYLVSRIEVIGYRNIRGLYIEIWRNSLLTYPYVGKCSYDFWGPKQFGPYSSSHGGLTPEMAFDDAMSGITHFDRKEYPNSVVFFVEYDDDHKMVFFDGDGEQVTDEEVGRRRAEYLKSSMEGEITK